jgi:hypothetical protein
LYIKQIYKIFQRNRKNYLKKWRVPRVFIAAGNFGSYRFFRRWEQVNIRNLAGICKGHIGLKNHLFTAVTSGDISAGVLPSRATTREMILKNHVDNQ